jgi:hypothetical protein
VRPSGGSGGDEYEKSENERELDLCSGETPEDRPCSPCAYVGWELDRRDASMMRGGDGKSDMPYGGLGGHIR